MRRVLMAFAIAVVAVGLAACGSSSKKSSTAKVNIQVQSGGDVFHGQKGGTLTVLAQSDVDVFDPGQTYEQFSYSVFLTTARPLYNYEPPKYDLPKPDLAAGPPQISADNKTVTIPLKKGIKFQPPVNRVMTSADVKYGIERTFTKNVPNGYVSAYLGAMKGVKAFQDGKADNITGIETPDDNTVVFKLDQPQGGVFAAALVLEATSPVPKDYALKFDKKTPSTYGDHQVGTGPYMFKNNSSGKVTGHTPGKEIVLVRNPNWDPKLDVRPAYVDKIDIHEGVTDATAATRKILNGSGIIDGNVVPPAEVMKPLVRSDQSDQLFFAASGGVRYVSMNTKVKPFDNINVRKAVIADIDRDALRLSRGGPILGDVASHIIPPSLPGFAEAGGVKGPGYDYLANTAGDHTVAAKYWKAAGYPSGKYTGGATILMVGENTGVPAKTAQVTRAQFQKMGFKVNFKAVPHDIMYTKFCNVPAQKVAVCPNTGFGKDFNDAQTMLDLTFNGDQIVPVQNSNWAQLNDPTINKLINEGRNIVGVDARAKQWGKTDRLIMAQAPVIPWVWDNYPITRAKDVVSVPNNFANGADLSYTWIKK
jgi:peptide/nickel transport system substrate-binding protein